MSEERRKTIAVDFDGVISDYSEGYRGKGEFGQVVAGAVEFMQQLHDDGWRIIIWTGRDEIGQVKKYLDANNIPFDYINENPDQFTDSRKIHADVYVDDRGIRFKGDWEKTYQEVSNFRSWEGRERN